MPLVTFCPKNSEIESDLISKMEHLRAVVKTALWNVWEIPVHDAVVNLHKSAFAVEPDEYTADLVVLLETTPNRNLEKRADLLRNTLARALIANSDLYNLSIEIWIRFIPGSWCLVEEGEIKESVEHELNN